MNAKDIIRWNMDMGDVVIQKYLEGLSDSDLLIRPVPGMNHIAWQLGHLIASERHFTELVRPGSSPPLPEGFEEGHGRESFTVDDPTKFYPLARYQELWKAQRDATRAVLDSLDDADLGRTEEHFPPYAKTVGALLSLAASHPVMHCGQFVAVRRKLGKPVAI